MMKSELGKTLYELNREDDLELFGELLREISESGDVDVALTDIGTFLTHEDPHLLNEDSLLGLRGVIDAVLRKMKGEE